MYRAWRRRRQVVLSRNERIDNLYASDGLADVEIFSVELRRSDLLGRGDDQRIPKRELHQF